MSNNINLEESTNTCDKPWTMDVVKNAPLSEPSFTSLGGLEGASPADTIEGVLYGAEFMPVDMHTPYYERMIHTTVDVPWTAQPEEVTYMNKLKEMNEPPVLTYQDLKLSSIPQNTYEKYEGIEGFGEGTYDFVFKGLLILFLVFFIYYLMKQVN